MSGTLAAAASNAPTGSSHAHPSVATISARDSGARSRNCNGGEATTSVRSLSSTPAHAPTGRLRALCRRIDATRIDSRWRISANARR